MSSSHSYHTAWQSGNLLQKISTRYGIFSNCAETKDDKHIRITELTNSGSYYYMGFFTIVLSVVYAKYEFNFVDIWKKGRNSDGGLTEKITVNETLWTGTLNLPTPPDTVKGPNFALVADDAFAIGEYLLKPFPLWNLSTEQKICTILHNFLCCSVDTYIPAAA